MKTLIVILLSTLLSIPALADDDKPIKAEELPTKAKEFINTHFKDVKISLAIVEKELFETSYEVLFTDGNKIGFDGEGNWEEIESRNSKIPNSVVPVKILTYTKSKHTDNFIKKIERDSRHYEVKLDNGLELIFDNDFNFKGYDD